MKEDRGFQTPTSFKDRLSSKFVCEGKAKVLSFDDTHRQRAEEVRIHSKLPFSDIE